jgi:hypothetical protein
MYRIPTLEHTIAPSSVYLEVKTLCSPHTPTPTCTFVLKYMCMHVLEHMCTQGNNLHREKLGHTIVPDTTTHASQSS